MNMLRKSLGLLMGRRPAAMQVGALCLQAGSDRVLLITSRDTGRWIIPKGWPMAGRSLHGAAALEAWEEAGVRGHVGRHEIGRYSYDKRQDSGYGVPVEVRVFLFHVTGLADDFPEAAQRSRRWFDAATAADLVAEPGLKSLLLQLPAIGILRGGPSQ